VCVCVSMQPALARPVESTAVSILSCPQGTQCVVHQQNLLHAQPSCGTRLHGAPTQENSLHTTPLLQCHQLRTFAQ
jgi:hypothetical protein